MADQIDPRLPQRVVLTDANGNLAPVASSGVPVTLADGADVTQGVTTGAAVITDANGTVQQYLRGLVKLALSGFAAIGNVAAGAADSGAPVKTGGKYVAAGVTLADGNRGDTELDLHGNTNANLGTLMSGENQTFNRMMVLPNYTYTNITATSSVILKSGAGFLHTLTFNQPIATNIVTIFDNVTATGSIVGKITVPSSPQPVTLHYDAILNTGLSISSATASSDFTVAWL